VPAIYDEIKRLYDALNEGDFKLAKELLGSLVSKGVDKDFIEDGFKTLGFMRQVEVLYDEVQKSKKK